MQERLNITNIIFDNTENHKKKKEIYNLELREEKIQNKYKAKYHLI